MVLLFEHAGAHSTMLAFWSVAVQWCSQVKRLSSATQQGTSSPLTSAARKQGILASCVFCSVTSLELDLIHDLLPMLNQESSRDHIILVIFSSYYLRNLNYYLQTRLIKPACPVLLYLKAISAWIKVNLTLLPTGLWILWNTAGSSHKALQLLRKGKSISYFSRQLWHSGNKDLQGW